MEKPKKLRRTTVSEDRSFWMRRVLERNIGVGHCAEKSLGRKVERSLEAHELDIEQEVSVRRHHAQVALPTGDGGSSVRDRGALSNEQRPRPRP